jgi:hypothetical protein
VLEPATRDEAIARDRGMGAERTLAIPEAVFEFLSDLENHWALTDRFVEVLELERGGYGRIQATLDSYVRAARLQLPLFGRVPAPAREPLQFE